MSRTYHSAATTVAPPQGHAPIAATPPMDNRSGVAAAAGVVRSETAVTHMVEFDASGPGPADFDRMSDLGPSGGPDDERRGHPGGLLGILRRRARWIGLRLRVR
jgi:hypothetical protein